MAAERSIEPQPRGTSLRDMARAYGSVVRLEHRLAAASVFLYVVSGVAEVTGLGLLVPLFGRTSAAGGGGSIFVRLLETLSFHGRTLIWAAVAGFALASLVAAFAKYAADAAMLRVRARTEAHLRKDFTERLLGMEWSAFVMMRFGEMANSLMMESSQVGAGVQYFVSGIGSALVTCAFIVLALLLSVRLTLVVVAFAAVGFVVLRPMARRAERHTEGLTEATTNIARQVADVLGNLKFFRSTGSRRRAEELFAAGYDSYAAWFQRTLVSPYTTRLLFEISAVVFVVVLLVVSLVGSSGLSATTLVFLAIFFRLSPRIRDLQDGVVRSGVQYPWLARWEEQRTAASMRPANPTGTVQPTFSGGIAVDAASFAFPGTTTLVLDEVSWQLGRGETVAFVGESGAGKTTLLDLVTGLLAPTQGRIAIDGVPLGDLDLEEWQSHIGLVLQESPLFHGTVRENVAGDRETKDALIWECLAAAHADAFVRGLPTGLDTIIGERGGRLSGGQRQRIGLARALYRRPWLLILDEATSALDSVSEDIVLEALRGLHGRVSMMIVAHRLITVEMADRIYVLDGGRITQSGSWNELLADRGGGFARMAAKQGISLQAAL